MVGMRTIMLLIIKKLSQIISKYYSPSQVHIILFLTPFHAVVRLAGAVYSHLVVLVKATVLVEALRFSPKPSFSPQGLIFLPNPSFFPRSLISSPTSILAPGNLLQTT